MTAAPRPPTAPQDRSATLPSAPWTAWANEVRACQRCALAAHRTQVVLYRGAPHPVLAFVGEAPGVAEDRTGLPFVGRAGRCLDRAIATLGIEETRWGVLNVVKCRPPNNRLPASAVTACRPFLERQLTMLDPRVIVTLGAHALASLDAGAPAVSAAAGQPRVVGARTIFPLVHPAATFRSRRYAERWDADVLRLGAWLRTTGLETL